MWDKAKRVYLINDMVITKELATSFVSVGTIKEFRPFLQALEIKWSDDGLNWREMSDIAKDMMKIFEDLPTDKEVEKYNLGKA